MVRRGEAVGDPAAAVVSITSNKHRWFLIGEGVRVEYPEHVVTFLVAAASVWFSERRRIDGVRCHVNHWSRRNSPVAVDAPLVHLAGVWARVERRSELAYGELCPRVDIEDISRVLHREHIELVAYDERRHVDFFVNNEFANLLQPGNVRGGQNRFEFVPTFAGVVDTNRRHIDGVDRRR